MTLIGYLVLASYVWANNRSMGAVTNIISAPCTPQEFSSQQWVDLEYQLKEKQSLSQRGLTTYWVAVKPVRESVPIFPVPAIDDAFINYNVLIASRAHCFCFPISLNVEIL